MVGVPRRYGIGEKASDGLLHCGVGVRGNNVLSAVLASFPLGENTSLTRLPAILITKDINNFNHLSISSFKKNFCPCLYTVRLSLNFSFL